VKILLVEDEYLIAMVEKNALKNYGYEVTHIPSGEKAIEVVKTEVFDLILMDINLENELDGIETAQIILDDLDIPIIFVSSHTEKEVVERTERVTSYGYVVKSSTITVLDASIKMAMKLFKAKKEVEKYALTSRDTEEELAIIAEHLKVKADELKEKNLFLNAILENAPIGISVTDRDGNALRYNHRLYSILGMDEKDLRVKKYLNRKYIKRDGSIRLKEEMPSYIAINEGRVVEPTEIGIIKEDGNEIWVNVSAAPMEDGSCIVLTNDITYRVERRNVNK